MPGPEAQRTQRVATIVVMVVAALVGTLGALPQTDQRPSASAATFTAGVADLWEAVRQDRPELGLPFCFPKSAYLQVKAIGASVPEERIYGDDALPGRRQVGIVPRDVAHLMAR